MFFALLITISSPVRGVGRYFTPDVMSAGVLALIFGFRPFFPNRFEVQSFYGFVPSQESLDKASIVGLTCLAFLWIGTKIRSSRLRKSVGCVIPLRERLRSVPTSHYLLVATGFSLGYVTLLTVVAGPSALEILGRGRSGAEGPTAGMPEIVLILPLAASICGALFIYVQHGQKTFLSIALPAMLMIGQSFLLVSQLGNRRFIIPALLMPVISYLLLRTRRVTLGHFVAASIAVLFIAVVPMVRSAGARLPNENLFDASYRYILENGISGVLEPIFTTYDTEMLDYIAVVSDSIGSPSLPFGLGSGTILQFLSIPIPASFSSKETFSDEIMTYYFGGGCGTPACPVASVAGVLYFEGGLVIVALGSFALGFFLRSMAHKWEVASTLSPGAFLWLVIVCGYALVGTRTNTTHAVWWAIYTFIIGYVSFWIISKIPRMKPDRRLTVAE